MSLWLKKSSLTPTRSVSRAEDAMVEATPTFCTAASIAASLFEPQQCHLNQATPGLQALRRNGSENDKAYEKAKGTVSCW